MSEDNWCPDCQVHRIHALFARCPGCQEDRHRAILDRRRDLTEDDEDE